MEYSLAVKVKLKERNLQVIGWNESKSGGVRESRFRKQMLSMCFLFLRFSDAKPSDAEYIPE